MRDQPVMIADEAFVSQIGRDATVVVAEFVARQAGIAVYELLTAS